jgi:glycosyltransferase involved in cell wall biosynthesis
MTPPAEAISLCMIVKDEERTLGRCLDSVRDLVGQIVVVDTGSADQTPRIAASYGAEVSSFDFTFVDFAAARNRALARATGRWILVLDADEVLHSADAPLVRELAARDANAGYYFRRMNGRIGAEGGTTDYVVRLFPNRPGYRYRGRVHETIDAAILAGGGRLIRTAIGIHHDFASDPEARRRRNLWYIGILKEEIAAHPDDDSRLDFLAAEYHQLGMWEQAAAVAERIASRRACDARAHLHVGVYHLLCGGRERARGDFQRALALHPGYPEASAFLRHMDEQERAWTTPVAAMRAPCAGKTEARL